MVTTLGCVATLEQLGTEKYALLTTFRKDGRAVSTPLWVMPDGDGVAFWTPDNTGKVKRIRNSGRVTITACDINPARLKAMQKTLQGIRYRVLDVTESPWEREFADPPNPRAYGSGVPKSGRLRNPRPTIA